LVNATSVEVTMDTSNDDFYKELRRDIRAWLADKGSAFKYADILLLAPDLFHLLVRLELDPRIPVPQKAELAAAIVYFISPIDLLPEAILGPAGYLDDVALAAWVFNRLINAGHGEIAREHWAGHGDVFEAIQYILAQAEHMIGTGLWNRLKGSFGG